MPQWSWRTRGKVLTEPGNLPECSPRRAGVRRGRAAAPGPMDAPLGRASPLRSGDTAGLREAVIRLDDQGRPRGAFCATPGQQPLGAQAPDLGLEEAPAGVATLAERGTPRRETGPHTPAPQTGSRQ